MPDYPLAWYWRARLPERRGQRCRILARGALGSIKVKFRDGFRVVTSRHAVRPPPESRQADLFGGAR